MYAGTFVWAGQAHWQSTTLWKYSGLRTSVGSTRPPFGAPMLRRALGPREPSGRRCRIGDERSAPTPVTPAITGRTRVRERGLRAKRLDARYDPDPLQEAVMSSCVTSALSVVLLVSCSQEGNVDSAL